MVVNGLWVISVNSNGESEKKIEEKELHQTALFLYDLKIEIVIDLFIKKKSLIAKEEKYKHFIVNTQIFVYKAG